MTKTRFLTRTRLPFHGHFMGGQRLSNKGNDGSTRSVRIDPVNALDRNTVQSPNSAPSVATALNESAEGAAIIKPIPSEKVTIEGLRQEFETQDLSALLRVSPKPPTNTSARSTPVYRASSTKARSVSRSKPSVGRPVRVVRTVQMDMRRRPVNGFAKAAISSPTDQPECPAAAPTPVLPIYEGLYELVQSDVVEQLRMMKPRFSGAMPSLENLLFAYALATVLRADVDEWQLFCMAPEWRRRRPRPSLSTDDQENALWHVMRFLHGVGPNASLPVKQAMALLRSHWEQNVTPYDLHEILMREEKPETDASVAVRLMDGEFARQFLTLPPGTKATVHLRVLPSKGRAKHVFEIAGVHAEPL